MTLESRDKCIMSLVPGQGAPGKWNERKGTL